MSLHYGVRTFCAETALIPRPEGFTNEEWGQRPQDVQNHVCELSAGHTAWHICWCGIGWLKTRDGWRPAPGGYPWYGSKSR